MRKKRWLTAGMAVIAAAAVIMAATSYNEIRKKLNMQCENQKTMLVAGYELQTENTEKEKDVESESSSGKKIQTKSEEVKESVEETKVTESSETKATESSDKETETQKATEKETTAKSGAPVVKLRKTKSVIQAGDLMRLIRLKVLPMIRMSVLFCLARFRFRVTTARMNRALIR